MGSTPLGAGGISLAAKLIVQDLGVEDPLTQTGLLPGGSASQLPSSCALLSTLKSSPYLRPTTTLMAPLSSRMPRPSMSNPSLGVTLLSPMQVEGELWTGRTKPLTGMAPPLLCVPRHSSGITSLTLYLLLPPPQPTSSAPRGSLLETALADRTMQPSQGLMVHWTDAQTDGAEGPGRGASSGGPFPWTPLDMPQPEPHRPIQSRTMHLV